MKVLMSGGGTAGHVYPALTVAALLAEEHDEVTFVGTPSGLEARLVPEAGIRFVPLSAAGFDRARPWTLVTSSARIAVSAARAWRDMGRVRPDVVLGFGGFVSIPVGIAAVLRRVPLVLHEQNSVPGLANRMLSRFARSVAVTYEESIHALAHPERAVVTGNPVRADVLSATRIVGRRALGVDESQRLLLVFGGSRGARHLNSALLAVSQRLLSDPLLVVVHVAGPAECDAVAREVGSLGLADSERWRVLDYVEDMGSAIAAADLVIARAGATSIAEITSLGTPAVLVPYPFATDDHQSRNAATMVAHGAAEVFADSEIDGEAFGDTVVRLLGDPAARATMSAASRALGRRDAGKRVVDVVRGADGKDAAVSADRATSEDSRA